MSNRHDELKRLARSFTATFNAHDLDATMAFFADSAVYEEMHGPVREGKAAIRKAFEALFSKRFGDMRFDEEDTFADADAGRVMISWVLHLSALDGKAMKLRGLDLLWFEGDRLVRKLTYCKAKEPRYVDA